MSTSNSARRDGRRNGIVPFVIVDDGLDELFAGFMWSGSWQSRSSARGEQLHVAASFPLIEADRQPDAAARTAAHLLRALFAHRALTKPARSTNSSCEASVTAVPSNRS